MTEIRLEVFMSQFSPKVWSFALVAALSMVAAIQAQAQAKLVPVASTNAQPADTGSARAWHDPIPDHLISARVRDGVLTIDGMVAKVQLNYDIQRTGYMYFFVPGVGTAVVSMAPIAEGVKVADAFDGETLAFSVDGHSVELSSDVSLLPGRKSHSKADVYVRLDRSTVALSRYPRMGYGDTTASPYVWPLSNPELASKEKVEYVVPPPPLPKSVLPQTASNH
jgi:hypothetical protein